MDPSFHINRIPDSEEGIELLNEALVSTNPPLLRRAVEEIAAIQGNRLEALEGSDRLVAGRFFELLEGIPPVEGVRSHNLLRSILAHDFDLDLVLAELDQQIATAEETGAQKDTGDDGLDEFGYVHGRGILSPVSPVDGQEIPPEITFPLALDVHASQRDAMAINMEIVLLLLETENRELRVGLIDDSGSIVRLRKFLDLSPERPAE